MKKILIVTNNMNIGGIQKALLELLKALATRKDLSVSLFCCNQSGEFLNRIPPEITLLQDNRWAESSELSVNDCKRIGKRFYAFRALAAVWSKLLHKGLPAKILCAVVGSLGSYDVAISFSQPIHDKAFCNLSNEVVLRC